MEGMERRCELEVKTLRGRMSGIRESRLVERFVAVENQRGSMRRR